MNALPPSGTLTQADPPAVPVVETEGGTMPTVNIDFRRILAAIYRNRFYIAGIMLVAIALGIVITLSTTPIYQSTATVQIDSQARQVLDSEAESADAVDYDIERFLQTQIDVLRSRATAARVANSLNLAASDEYFRRMLMTAPAVPASGKTMAETRRDAIISSLRGNVVSEVPRMSRVVQISFTSPDAEYAALIANSYAENFIAANLQRRFDSSAYARKYLEEQLALAKDRLEASERAQIDYARAAGLFDLETRTNDQGESSTSSLLLSNLVADNTALNEARAARIQIEERYRVAAGGNLLSVPEVATSAVIQQLLQQRATNAAEQSRDAERYRADHPVMLQHQQQLRSLDQQINANAQRIRESLRQQYQAAMRSEQELAGRVRTLTSGTQDEQAKRVRLNILAREASTNRTMYDGLLQRYKEVSASAGVSTNNISLIDRAGPGGLIAPQPEVNLALALIAGLIASVVFVLLRDYYDDATRTPDDVVNKLQVPFLGILPKMPAGMTPAEVLDDPKSSMSEAFAALRTSMSLLSTDGGLRAVMVTSSRESEGKSMVVHGIARSFARLGKRVLVVDSDLRRPSQHRLFELPRDTGLTNVLTRQASWREMVQKSDNPNVDFLASGPLPPSVPELLSSAAYEELVRELEQAYDLVVIDAPPVLGLADVILLGHIIPHLVYVIESGRPLRGRGLAAVRRLRAAGIKIDGAVLNKFDPKHAGYGYEYGYYYYYGKEDE